MFPCLLYYEHKYKNSIKKIFDEIFHKKGVDATKKKISPKVKAL